MLQKLSGLGGTLALVGLVSSVLSLVNYELVVLMWVDRWGTGVGWGIRIGLIVIGALLAGVGLLMAPNDPAAATDDDD
jgi:hypothetical protein